jgi:hypothetical protein
MLYRCTDPDLSAAPAPAVRARERRRLPAVPRCDPGGLEAGLAAMEPRRTPSERPAHGRTLVVFATLWSLRQYPTRGREWSWAKKFQAIRDARCDGVFSPPIPGAGGTGGPSVPGSDQSGRRGQGGPGSRGRQATRCARASDVQLGDYDSPVAEMVRLARRIDEVAGELGVALRDRDASGHVHGNPGVHPCARSRVPCRDGQGAAALPRSLPLRGRATPGARGFLGAPEGTRQSCSTPRCSSICAPSTGITVRFRF